MGSEMCIRDRTYSGRSYSNVFCQPTPEGFFGSTVGESLLIKYSFGLEVKPGSDMKEVFQAFSEAIEDFLIGKYYGDICTYHNPDRRRLNGFKFNPVLHDAEFGKFNSS